MRIQDRRNAASHPPLVRFLSKCNVATRVEARQLVQAGRVTINGQVCTDGERRVNLGRDAVALDGTLVRRAKSDEIVWIAMNKPRGVIVTTHDPEGRRTVMDLLPQPLAPGLAPVGRLDGASAGLLLLSNDTEAAARLLEPSQHVPKVYRVKVTGHPSAATLASWNRETLVEDGLKLGPMHVEIEKQSPKSVWLIITLTEGRNRQIRRRMRAAGHDVQHLIRTTMGSIQLGDLAPGAVRTLSEAEVRGLFGARR